MGDENKAGKGKRWTPIDVLNVVTEGTMQHEMSGDTTVVRKSGDVDVKDIVKKASTLSELNDLFDSSGNLTLENDLDLTSMAVNCSKIRAVITEYTSKADSLPSLEQWRNYMKSITAEKNKIEERSFLNAMVVYKYSLVLLYEYILDLVTKEYFS